jgi:hypothetical protein
MGEATVTPDVISSVSRGADLIVVTAQSAIMFIKLAGEDEETEERERKIR